MQHLQRNWSTCLIIYKDKCRYGFCVAKQKTWFIQPLHTSSVSMLDLKELKGCTLRKKKKQYLEQQIKMFDNFNKSKKINKMVINMVIHGD